LVYVSHLQDCTVILDLFKNEYLGVGQEERQLVAHVIPDWPALPPSETMTQTKAFSRDEALRAANQLKAAGILNRHAAPETIIESLSVSVDGDIFSLRDEADTRSALHARDVVQFAAAYAYAKIGLRFRALHEVVREIRNTKRAIAASCPPPTREQLGAAIGAFRGIRPYVFAAKGQCLVHALALMRFLLQRHLAATWVIGVRTSPWGAHTWVQYENLILDSDPERVVEFTPILAI
jgi:hypothetical protein